jgi:hypothetical protein
MIADSLTKPLSKDTFEKLRDQLKIVRPEMLISKSSWSYIRDDLSVKACGSHVNDVKCRST